MTQDDVKTLGEVRDGARLLGSLPYIRDEIERMEKSIVGQAFALLDQNKLTPEIALEAWRNLRLARKLWKGLETKVKLGVAAGEQMAGTLNGQEK